MSATIAKQYRLDIVICFDVIGILDDESRKQAINELLRVLKSNGILILQLATYEWLRSQHDQLCNIKKRFTTPMRL